jgi:RNA polymerase sigma factor (sigma-70 family)
MGLVTVVGQNQTTECTMKRKQKGPRFLRPLACVELLTPDEESSLFEAIAKGDTGARERVILAHLPLAAKLARKWRGRGLELEDLVSEATCGLIRAVDRFDPTREMSFRTFASVCIKQSVSTAVEESGNLLALPTHTWKLVRRWKRGVRALTTALGRTPTTEEIAESLNFGHGQTRCVTAALTVGVKLASTILGDGCMLEPLENRYGEDAPWQKPVESAENKILRQRLKRLSSRERLVLSLRYGLDGNRCHSLEDVADVLEVSKAAIKAIQFGAEQKLRAGPYPYFRRQSGRK